MNVDELYDLVEDFFGYKAKMRYLNSATKEVACILYDSFWLKCDLDDQYGRFGAGLEIGKEGLITEFLGKSGINSYIVFLSYFHSATKSGSIIRFLLKCF